MQHRYTIRTMLGLLSLAIVGGVSLAGFNLQPATGQETQPTVSSPGSAQAMYLPLVYNNPTTVFGIEMGPITNNAGLELVDQANISWVRKNALLWSDVQSTKEGGYDWTTQQDLEQHLINARRSNLEVVLVVRSTPSWAQLIPGKSCGPIKYEELSAFGDFLYEAVKRYSVGPYYVRYWQIWNEPDVDWRYMSGDNPYGCWAYGADDNSYYDILFGGEYFGGEYYGDVLANVYPRMKAANPNIQVLVGGLLFHCNYDLQHCYEKSVAPRYIEGIIYRHGYMDGANYFDGVGFHAYDDYRAEKVPNETVYFAYGNVGWGNYSLNGDGPVVHKKASYLKRVLASYGVNGKFLMATETSLRYCQNPDDPEVPYFPETKSYYVAQLYGATIAEGLKAALWYDLIGGWCNVNLLNSDLSTTPAYQAYSFARKELVNAAYLGPVNEFPDVLGYKFNRKGTTIWLLWSQPDAAPSINLPAVPVKAYDVYGNALTIASTDLQVTTMPVYLEGLP